MVADVITEDLQSKAKESTQTASVRLWIYWLAGVLAVLILGTWFVWYSAYVQRKFAEDDVRAACRRVMPETTDRCFDTVVIQRGGVRR